MQEVGASCEEERCTITLLQFSRACLANTEMESIMIPTCMIIVVSFHMMTMPVSTLWTHAHSTCMSLSQSFKFWIVYCNSKLYTSEIALLGMCMYHNNGPRFCPISLRLMFGLLLWGKWGVCFISLIYMHISWATENPSHHPIILAIRMLYIIYSAAKQKSKLFWFWMSRQLVKSCENFANILWLHN